MPLFRKKKSEEAEIDLDARSERSGLRFKDIAIMGEMVERGADLNQPRHALYYVYFPSLEIAQQAAQRATAAGYRTQVREPPPAYPDQWCVLSERDDALLDVPGVRAADDLFQGIADELGGDFDGWEAAL